MIYEFALEPKLVATWSDRDNFRYFVTKFGLGEGRLVSRYPKRWKKLVWEAFKKSNDMETKRMEELIIRIAEKMVIRSNFIWDKTKTWFENAEDEHQRYPFYAILAQQNPNNREHKLKGNELGEIETPLWNVEPGTSVKRRPIDMAEAVSGLLSNCSIIIFIDPHFGPEKNRYRRPLKAFLDVLTNNRGGHLPSRIEYHTSDDAEADFFKTTCEERMPRVIPKGLKVRFVRWGQRPNGERLHNRYILTDIGGVSFQFGLDEGRENETDDISLLKRKQYELRWSQYASEKPVFDLVDCIEIEGR